MAVDVVTDTPEDAIPAKSDAEVIDGVEHGAFEMAVVPARAWSDNGVMSFRALQAPFLIDSDEQAAAIVSDEGISAQLFSGLAGSGVTGLALYPEGLRHLFGFEAPILTPGDMAGRQIRSNPSSDTDAIIEALGGIPMRAGGEAMQKGVDDGTIRGLESSFTLMSDEHWLPIATGNVVPYAHVGSLVVNDEFWASLTDAQRTIVSEAANSTRAWAIDNLVGDPEAAASYCATGGSVKLTDPASIGQFRRATSHMLADLAKDPATDALMAKMRGAAKGLVPAPVEACGPPKPLTIEPDGGSLPNGIYRVGYTDEYLKRWGVRNFDSNNGVWTYRLRDGTWTIDSVADNGVADHDEGIYQVEGDELFWRWDNDPGWPIDHLTWSMAQNGDLSFVAAPDSPDAWPFGLRFIRIGPLSD